jgi:hypothetical protein
MDRSEGNLNRGFSMKNYPDFYPPNIIPALGCDFFELMANLQIYGRTFANKYFRLRLMYFLFVRCGFFGKG